MRRGRRIWKTVADNKGARAVPPCTRGNGERTEIMKTMNSEKRGKKSASLWSVDEVEIRLRDRERNIGLATE